MFYLNRHIFLILGNNTAHFQNNSDLTDNFRCNQYVGGIHLLDKYRLHHVNEI